MKALSDADLQAKTPEFRQRLDNGEDLDDLLVEAFAVMREAAFRVIGQRHFDVQLMGGAALHFGWIAEMKTGEGKTLVSTLPAYLNGLTGKGLHLVTVNDYLARRDARVDGPDPPVDGALASAWSSRGCASGRPRSGWTTAATSPTAPTTRSASTTCATTWPPRPTDKVQRGHVYAIVDEVDSILIDEARTPLIISGRVADAAKLYYRFASVARSLAPRRRLRGGRGEAQRLPDREGHRAGRARARRREPLRRRPAEPGPPAPGRAAGQGAVQAGQGLHHPGRRGEDRRRVHRSHPGGPALERGPAPGRRGQGGGEDQGGEPDPRHGHPPELLPHVRQAGRDDRHGHHRVGRADEHLRPAGRAHPHQPAGGPRRPGRPHLQVRAGQVRRRGRGPRRAVRDRPAGPGRHGQRRQERVPGLAARQARHPPRGAQRQAAHPGGRASSPRPGGSARSPWPPTWPGAASTSCSAATPRGSPARRS